MKKILVPYDFSLHADHALEFAQQVSQKHRGATITLHYTVEDPIPKDFDSLEIQSSDTATVIQLKEKISQIESKLERFANSLDPTGELIKHKLSLRALNSEIAQYRVRGFIDLVIMGLPPGQRDETNSSYIVALPIIYIKSKTDLTDIKDILVVMGAEGIDDAFVDKLLALQQVCDAKLQFVSHNQNDQLLEQLIIEHKITNYTLNSFPEAEETEAVLAYAQKINCQLIAVAHPQLSDVKYYLETSLAEQLIQQSILPVWSFPNKT